MARKRKAVNVLPDYAALAQCIEEEVVVPEHLGYSGLPPCYSYNCGGRRVPCLE